MSLVEQLSEDPNVRRQLVSVTRPFGRESRSRSWWYVGSTLTALAATLGVAALAPAWPVRLAAGVLAGLLMARGFILYHDFMHGAILRRSKAAKVLMYAYGVLVLAPPRSWRKSHNFHHLHVGKLEGSSVGSFWIMTTAQWRAAPWTQRLHYRVVRSPVTMLLSYVTVFFWSMTVASLVRDPRRHWDSAIAIVVHAAIIAGAWLLGGAALATFLVFVPLGVASALGAYLFYAQHNFVGMRVLSETEWSMQRAALESCSYLRLGRTMRWLTGDIGFHHVHHLNAAIPFYRLAEAMDQIPELQSPTVTTLHPKDVIACLRLKLWDEDRGRMVGYAAAAA
jgi:omega-6 fatty acid desaturase (delta-12 desaturase)